MATQTDSTTNGDKRLKPHQLSLGLGIGMGAFILLSGVLPQITHWHNENEVHRTVFGNILASPSRALHPDSSDGGVGRIRFADRMKTGSAVRWRNVAPPQKTSSAAPPISLAGVYMRTLLRDSAAGLMHSMIYFGFLVLMGVTTVLEIDHQMPESLKFLHGTTYKAYAFVGDFAGTVFTVGVIQRSSAATSSARIASASKQRPSTLSSSAPSLRLV